MNRALIYLVSRSLVNAIAFRLRRLKQPKYLAGAVFGALYFYVYFLRHFIHGARGSGAGPVMPLGDLGIEIVSLSLCMVAVVFSWLWPGSRAALHFSEAEIAWLFPAPLDRPTLIRFKLLKSQLTLLFLAFVMAFFTGRAAQGVIAWIHVLSWWLVFSTLQMHRIAASFALQRLTQRGLADWKRRLAVIVGTTAFAVAIYFWRRSAPNPPSDPIAGEWIAWLRSVLHAGPAPWFLLPFRVVVQPWFASTFSGFLLALPAALTVMALHYFWIVRAHVSFEEASVALSQKRAALLAARRSGNLRAKHIPHSASTAAFHLRSTGFEPVSFFWKHLLSIGGRRSLLRWFTGGALALAIAFALTSTDHWPAAPVIVAVVAFALLVLIPFINTAHGASAVRRDLLAIDLLKTFPIPGWKILLGELIGPVFCTTALQIFALAVLVVSIGSVPGVPAPVHRLAPLAGFSIALLIPSINLTLVIIPTAATLFFPAWFNSGEALTPGLETGGLRIIMALGQMLALALALVPAAILGGVAWMSAQMLGAPHLAMIAGAGAAALTLGIEACMGLVWLGHLFDAFDPSES